MLTVQITGAEPRSAPACSPPPLLFTLWAPSLDLAGAHAVDDESTRLPAYLDLWATSPAFPNSRVDRNGRTTYSPTGYLYILFDAPALE